MAAAVLSRGEPNHDDDENGNNNNNNNNNNNDNDNNDNDNNIFTTEPSELAEMRDVRLHTPITLPFPHPA